MRVTYSTRLVGSIQVWYTELSPSRKGLLTCLLTCSRLTHIELSSSWKGLLLTHSLAYLLITYIELSSSWKGQPPQSRIMPYDLGTLRPSRAASMSASPLRTTLGDGGASTGSRGH